MKFVTMTMKIYSAYTYCYYNGKRNWTIERKRKEINSTEQAEEVKRRKKNEHVSMMQLIRICTLRVNKFGIFSSQIFGRSRRAKANAQAYLHSISVNTQTYVERDITSRLIVIACYNVITMYVCKLITKFVFWFSK